MAGAIHHFQEEKNMSRKNIGLILIVIGLFALAGSLSIDILGLGGHIGIGRYQLLGIGIGFIIAVAGFFFSLQRKKGLNSAAGSWRKSWV